MTLHDAAFLMLRHRLTPAKVVILSLCAKDTQTMRDLARATLRTSAAATGLVDELSKSGLVLRYNSQTDRRMVEVVLTEAGRQQVNQMRLEGEDKDGIVPAPENTRTATERQLS